MVIGFPSGPMTMGVGVVLASVKSVLLTSLFPRPPGEARPGDVVAAGKVAEHPVTSPNGNQ